MRPAYNSNNGLPKTHILTHALPSPKPETTMSAVYQRNGIDPYLTALVRCLIEPMDLLHQIIPLLPKQMHSDANIRHVRIAYYCVRDVLGVPQNGLFDSASLLKQAGKFLKEGKRSDQDSDFVGKISEKEAKKLTQLKENLLNSKKFLVYVLLKYSSFDCKLPDIEKIKHASNTISKAIHSLKPDRLEQLVPDSLVTEEDVLCSVLGLNDEFADRLRNLRAGIRSHKTDMYFLTCFLKECYDSFDSEDLPDDAARLQKMGFTENRSNVIAKWIAAQPFPKHKSLLAWAEIYLKNLFKYDIFLNDLVPTFPYKENYLNGWFLQNVTRDREEDSRLVRESGAISAINTTTTEEAEAHIQEKITEFRNSNPNGQLYFHGTDHKSAKNILENGINLREGAPRCDFSHGKGFYVTNDFMYALPYAHSQTKAAAVIVFNICDAYLRGLRCLDLSGPGNHNNWLSVTNFFKSGEQQSNRPGQRLYNQIVNCHYIIGPISGGGVARGRRRQNLTQICIKKKEMAREIGNPLQIVGTVFLNTRDA